MYPVLETESFYESEAQMGQSQQLQTCIVNAVLKGMSLLRSLFFNDFGF